MLPAFCIDKREVVITSASKRFARLANVRRHRVRTPNRYARTLRLALAVKTLAKTDQPVPENHSNQWKSKDLRLPRVIVVGAAGFGLHLIANLGGPGGMRENFLYGAPIFSPLLFPNLALLAGIAVLVLADSKPVPAHHT